MRVPGAERRVGRTVGKSQAVVGVGLIHRFKRSSQVWPRIEGCLSNFVERRDLSGKIEWPGNVELLYRGPLIEHGQKLDFRGTEIDFRGLQVRFISYALQLQTVE